MEDRNRGSEEVYKDHHHQVYVATTRAEFHPAQQSARGYVATSSLEHEAATVLLAAAWAGDEGCAGGVLEDLANTLAGLGRALEVLLRTDALRDLRTL